MTVEATSKALESLVMTLPPTGESDLNTESSIPLLSSTDDTKSFTSSTSTSAEPMLLRDVFASHIVRVAAGLLKGSQSVSPMNFAEDLVSGIDFLDEEKCIQ